MSRPPKEKNMPACRVAKLAVAQYLLFDATLESLSALGENVARLRKRAADEARHEEFSASELTEPFRVRYELFRRTL